MKPYETHGHYADSIDGFEEAQMLASIKVSKYLLWYRRPIFAPSLKFHREPVSW